MAVVKWTFLDLTDSSVVTLDINPDAGGSPQYKKTLTTQSTLAPGGKTLIYEGADSAPTISFSGTILTLALYNKFVTLFNKRHQIQLTDDLGRVYVVYLTDFQPVRVHHAGNFFFQTYTCIALIVDWP